MLARHVDLIICPRLLPPAFFELLTEKPSPGERLAERIATVKTYRESHGAEETTQDYWHYIVEICGSPQTAILFLSVVWPDQAKDYKTLSAEDFNQRQRDTVHDLMCMMLYSRHYLSQQTTDWTIFMRPVLRYYLQTTRQIA